MIARSQIGFAHAVALARLQELAGAIDAQALDHVAGPAATIGLDRQAALGREHALAAQERDVTLEVGLAPKQAEAVLDLPLDARRDAAARLGVGGGSAPRREQKRNEAEETELTHRARSDQPAA